VDALQKTTRFVVETWNPSVKANEKKKNYYSNFNSFSG
jgi:hypothetical protein